MGLKTAVRRVITSDAMVPLLGPLTRNVVAVQILHRFKNADSDGLGHPIDALRSSLAFLRKHRIHVASLGDLVAGRVDRHSVIFTVDDGYADFMHVALPVFMEFDCPVTVFLVTGAIDGGQWYWWDRVRYAVETTERSSVDLDLFGKPVTWNWTTPADRSAAVESISHALKIMPNTQKELTLTALADDLEVVIPATPTPRYAAMTWDDVRQCARKGVTFGPHTVTHPILPAVPDEDAKWEILESWRALRAECDAVLPVFAYPSGVCSVREVEILAGSDLIAALTTQPRYASQVAIRTGDPRVRYTLPRFSYTGDRAQFVQVVNGFERLKLAVRGSDHSPTI